MWTKRCIAENVRGGQCKRRSTLAHWCFRFMNESYKTPSWVETCGHHAHLANSIVATQDIRHSTKAG